jgi:hypothetical protein
MCNNPCAPITRTAASLKSCNNIYLYKLSETQIHEYDSKAKIKRLNFDLKFSKYGTNVFEKIKD